MYENLIEGAKDKTGVIRGADCCANCSFSQSSWCSKFNLSTYPGAVCDHYIREDKKVKRKLNSCEVWNKSESITNYLVAETGNRIAKVAVSELINYMPKKTYQRLEEALRNRGVGTEAVISRDGWFSKIEINGEEILLHNFTDDYSKIVKACDDYLYEDVKDRLLKIK